MLYMMMMIISYFKFNCTLFEKQHFTMNYPVLFIDPMHCFNMYSLTTRWTSRQRHRPCCRERSSRLSVRALVQWPESGERKPNSKNITNFSLSFPLNCSCEPFLLLCVLTTYLYMLLISNQIYCYYGYYYYQYYCCCCHYYEHYHYYKSPSNKRCLAMKQEVVVT